MFIRTRCYYCALSQHHGSTRPTGIDHKRVEGRRLTVADAKGGRRIEHSRNGVTDTRVRLEVPRGRKVGKSCVILISCSGDVQPAINLSAGQKGTEFALIFIRCEAVAPASRPRVFHPVRRTLVTGAELILSRKTNYYSDAKEKGKRRSNVAPPASIW